MTEILIKRKNKLVTFNLDYKDAKILYLNIYLEF